MNTNRNTNRILATLGVVLVLLTVGALVAIRVFAAPGREHREGGPAADAAERQLAVERFTGVELHGGWKLQFTRASEYSAVLMGDRETVDAAEVSTAGDRLSIHLNGRIRDDRSVRIIITAPTISALTLAGAVDGRIAGLEATQLTVVTAGASKLVFKDSTIGDLMLETAGAANIDLGASLVENAVLDMAGASQLTINLNGGSLTGRVRGVGNVSYTGDASTVDLDTAALVKVGRK